MSFNLIPLLVIVGYIVMTVITTRTYYPLVRNWPDEIARPEAVKEKKDKQFSLMLGVMWPISLNALLIYYLVRILFRVLRVIARRLAKFMFGT